ncbi:MDR family MFS transporter [Paenibacillus kobensis]|uniref:MDR family MFS transporter n=1 Tax=Paenibacillus kobensis TaxID=59841 RepID=UPI001FEB9CDC|nr:MDR family MFS transporter [Paenibacillus kobensis]
MGMNEQSRARWITAGLLLGLLLASLDQTIVSTAMPTIIEELGGMSMYSWVFAIYMLASTAAMPIYGKLADLYGRRKTYMIGLSLFLAGSLLCGIAQSIGQLVVYRGIQGLGAGALLPISMTIVAELYPPEKRGKFMGLFSAVFALSSIVGPALGGVIVDHAAWGWIFLLNLPLGIPALFLIAAAMKESSSRGRAVIDWAGAFTLTAAIISLLLALVLGGGDSGARGHYEWTSAPIITLFGTFVICTVLFIWAEKKAKEPIIPLHLLALRPIAAGNAVGFFMSAGMFGAIVYIPLFIQGVIGVSASVAGYSLVPLMLSVIVASITGGKLMSRVSYRTILVPSMMLMVTGFVLLSQVSVNTSKLTIVLDMIVTGLGMGAIYPTVGTAAQSAVDQRDRGAATSVSQFFRSIGGTIGVSVFGSLLSSGIVQGAGQMNQITDGSKSMESLQGLADPQLLLDPGARAAMPAEQLAMLQKLFSHSLQHVFIGGLIAVSVGLAACFFMGGARLVPKPSLLNETNGTEVTGSNRG